MSLLKAPLDPIKVSSIELEATVGNGHHWQIMMSLFTVIEFLDTVLRFLSDAHVCGKVGGL